MKSVLFFLALSGGVIGVGGGAPVPSCPGRVHVADDSGAGMRGVGFSPKRSDAGSFQV